MVASGTLCHIAAAAARFIRRIDERRARISDRRRARRRRRPWARSSRSPAPTGAAARRSGTAARRRAGAGRARRGGGQHQRRRVRRPGARGRLARARDGPGPVNLPVHGVAAPRRRHRGKGRDAGRGLNAGARASASRVPCRCPLEAPASLARSMGQGRSALSAGLFRVVQSIQHSMRRHVGRPFGHESVHGEPGPAKLVGNVVIERDHRSWDHPRPKRVGAVGDALLQVAIDQGERKSQPAGQRRERIPEEPLHGKNRVAVTQLLELADNVAEVGRGERIVRGIRQPPRTLAPQFAAIEARKAVQRMYGLVDAQRMPSAWRCGSMFRIETRRIRSHRP